MSDTATSDDAAPKAGPGWHWIWAFHLVVVAVAGGVLWSVSYPDGDLYLLGAFGCTSVLVGCFWLGWTISVARTTGRRRGWFLAGPVVGVLTLALLCTGAPFKMRWAASRGAFAAVVAGHPIPPPGSEWEGFIVPRRLGLYSITEAGWVPGGAVFYEAHGGLYGAGFAYLPGGPTAELDTVELYWPQFKHLGGSWYRWIGNL
ncbi:hypothetical protein KZZ52_03090 [Dactylosporangium sp. AC04546]|uniref:hypothetical protein n=1 Tax=Dactylosporangium sp. AC04546 TaxID=2862460 RepID=UPI001EDE8C66|nr:hypothetical protein [Dactylosporangium sp. AC04546]WVK84438.1 hypothetical protein KZZ52_03090 [Dactylosporangium sp. AC04546]